MGIPVTLIPGDGIGPSIADATVRILAAAGADIDWDVRQAGLAALGAAGDPLPDATLDSIRRTGVALKGPLETPVGEGYRSVTVALRTAFDLYANVRPAHVVVRPSTFGCNKNPRPSLSGVLLLSGLPVAGAASGSIGERTFLGLLSHKPSAP